MPLYEYLCDPCGAFAMVRPMRESADPQPCPDCGATARRALLSVPQMSGLSTIGRVAATTNERSRHAPMTSGEYRAARHRAGCACCTPRSRGLAADAPKPAKGFPGKRPWMISH